MAALLYPRCEDLNKLHCLRMLQLKIQLFWPKDFWREDFKRLFSIFLIYQSPMEHRPQTILFLFHFSIECYVKKKHWPLWPYPTPKIVEMNKLESPLPEDASNRALAFLAKLFWEHFLKNCLYMFLCIPPPPIVAKPYPRNNNMNYLRIIQPPSYIFSDHMVFKRLKKKLSQFIFM